MNRFPGPTGLGAPPWSPIEYNEGLLRQRHEPYDPSSKFGCALCNRTFKDLIVSYINIDYTIHLYISGAIQG